MRGGRAVGRAAARGWRAASNGAGGEVYNEPGGRLFGEAPRQPGERRQWAVWEYVWYPTLLGAAIICGVGLSAAPDTRIKQWAIEEAREREQRLVAKVRAADAAKAAETVEVVAAVEGASVSAVAAAAGDPVEAPAAEP
mmetsp:Transcript_26195/g.63671  ORF Transcript_26195/g.63671 Transcript_26195/m.63671 type:complete len:139 (+) Transcript_26195:399-815(+)